jgi:Holliday junction DNA helicase RuvA
MISFLRGILHFKKPPVVVIDVNGVGYECQAPMSTFYKLPDPGQTVFLHTQFIVREDAQLLYGFYEQEERALFCSLIKVNNVGPKLALAILSGIEPEQFVSCIQQQNVDALIHIPGVGKKTAERLIVEMRDQLAGWQCQPKQGIALTSKEKSANLTQDALSALLSLGYKPQEASKLISRVGDGYSSAEELIRLALQSSLKGDKYDNNGSTDQRQLKE